jgi:hypothetical protein
MGRFSNGETPFSGWFGRQDDGKVRLTTSLARQACMIVEVNGLETVRRLRGTVLDVSAEMLATGAGSPGEPESAEREDR